jgi:hypothetical protein
MVRVCCCNCAEMEQINSLAPAGMKVTGWRMEGAWPLPRVKYEHLHRRKWKEFHRHLTVEKAARNRKEEDASAKKKFVQKIRWLRIEILEVLDKTFIFSREKSND